MGTHQTIFDRSHGVLACQFLLAGSDTLLHGRAQTYNHTSQTGLSIEECGVALQRFRSSFHIVLVIDVIDNRSHGMQEADSLETLIVVTAVRHE